PPLKQQGRDAIETSRVRPVEEDVSGVKERNEFSSNTDGHRRFAEPGKTLERPRGKTRLLLQITLQGITCLARLIRARHDRTEGGHALVGRANHRTPVGLVQLQRKSNGRGERFLVIPVNIRTLQAAKQ